MQTPQDAQRQKMLEEKLKNHIQREFNLGEKVIALLKQKKELESNLRDNQDAQGKLEKELELMVKSKEDVETKFLHAQKELQERQHKLKTRSRIIVEDEEQSRETLKQLQQKIRALQARLNTGDAQKLDEKKRLILNIRKLRKKEVLQRQKLQKIVQQRDSIEKRLLSVVKKYKHLASIHQQQKKQHEKLLEALYKEQINREARIELLRDEKQINEENLLKEIESLKQAKAELEEKLERVEQKVPTSSWEFDADLLQVIEKQNQYIQELKDKAHKRSAMLRAENDTLRDEMEGMLNSQEKAKWENKMLETSLKDLQEDLAEYIQLKNKFEEVQEEKERFEQLFRRRLQFIEDHGAEKEPEQNVSVDTSVRETQDKPEEQEEPLWKTTTQPESHEEPQEPTSFLKKWFSRNSRFMGWLNMAKPKILLAFLVLIVIALSVEIYRQIPWRYMRPLSVSELEEVTLAVPEEFSKIERLESSEKLTAERQGASTHQQQTILNKAGTQTVKTPLARDRATLAAKAPPRAQQTLKVSAVKKKESSQPTKKTSPTPLKTLDAIIVQLQAERTKRFLSQDAKPFPTVENNSILRRHQQQKLAALRR